MITLYSGTPGSGKSYHAARDIMGRFQHGGGLIANFPVVVPADLKPKKEFRFSYWDNSEITPNRLAAYAMEFHRIGVEGQTLVVIDEAQVIYNCREFKASDRLDWVKFFSQHRKLGFDILLIAQNDRMLDRQIRMLIETEVRHRKLNNYGLGGFFLSLFTGKSTWFIALTYWYGGNKLMMDRQMIRYSPKVAAIYDSYRMFDGLGDEIRPDREGAVLRLESYRSKRGLIKPFKNTSARDQQRPCATKQGSAGGSEIIAE